MSKHIASTSLRFGAWAALALVAWQLLPDRYMGPFQAWNPHAIMEFVITIFSISLAGKLAVHWLGAHYGLLLMGLMGGFASSTATIYTMGTVATSRPELADRAALGGVLSNIATLVQLAVLLQLLAPQLLALFIQPLCFGMAGMCVYALWVLVLAKPPVASTSRVVADDAQPFDWRGLLTLTAVVCGVSYASAALNAAYGQSGLWVGAAVSGLVDAHAIVPTVASLLTQAKLQPDAALMPLLIALSTNTFTKSLIAFQSGGWIYARQVSGGVWLTTAAVWLGYMAARAGFGF
jgi:uncharacterized membrane protein (DUF4010 family)